MGVMIKVLCDTHVLSGTVQRWYVLSVSCGPRNVFRPQVQEHHRSTTRPRSPRSKSPRAGPGPLPPLPQRGTSTPCDAASSSSTPHARSLGIHSRERSVACATAECGHYAHNPCCHVNIVHTPRHRKRPTLPRVLGPFTSRSPTPHRTASPHRTGLHCHARLELRQLALLVSHRRLDRCRRRRGHRHRRHHARQLSLIIRLRGAEVYAL